MDNVRRLVDYPNLWAYARDLYQRPGFGETVNFDHIKRHYYMTHPTINPNRIVPKGPLVDWNLPSVPRSGPTMACDAGRLCSNRAATTQEVIGAS